jgi:hypothetical protein
MSTEPDTIATGSPRLVTASTPISAETLGHAKSESPTPVEAVSKSVSEQGLAYENTRDFRLLSTEGIAFGIIVAVIGVVVWRFKHVRGIGDGLLAAGLLILLGNLFQAIQVRFHLKLKPGAQLYIRQVKVRAGHLRAKIPGVGYLLRAYENVLRRPNAGLHRMISAMPPVLVFPAKAGIHFYHGHRPSPV